MHERRRGVALAQTAMAQAPNDGKLRIIVFGAHPDDPEYRGAGVAMKWAKQGHHVKLVAATNGDVGHWEMAGGPLAQRRKKEVAEVARRMGVENEVLDIHDGEILPTLENRRMITRLIKQWNADIVITNRPNDYHPGSPVHVDPGAGFGFHGDGAVLHAGCAAAEEEPGVPVFVGPVSEAESVQTGCGRSRSTM